MFYDTITQWGQGQPGVDLEGPQNPCPFYGPWYICKNSNTGLFPTLTEIISEPIGWKETEEMCTKRGGAWPSLKLGGGLGQFPDANGPERGENGLFMKSVDGTKLEDAVETRWTSQVVLVGKNPPANVRDVRDWGLIHGSKDPLEEHKATHSSILAWRIPTDKRAWWLTVHRVIKSQTWLKWLNEHRNLLGLRYQPVWTTLWVEKNQRNNPVWTH